MQGAAAQVARRGGPSRSHSQPGLAGPAPLQLVLVQCNQTEMASRATSWHPPFQLRNNETGSPPGLELPSPPPGQARRAAAVEIAAWQQDPCLPTHEGVLPEPWPLKFLGGESKVQQRTLPLPALSPCRPAELRHQTLRNNRSYECSLPGPLLAIHEPAVKPQSCALVSLSYVSRLRIPSRIPLQLAYRKVWPTSPQEWHPSSRS